MQKIVSAVLIPLMIVWSFVAQATETANDKAAESENIPVAESVTPPVAAKTAGATETQKESEIALNLDKDGKANSGSSSAAKAILSIVVISIMAGAAFFLLKKYSYKTKVGKNQPQIKVLTQHYLGPKKSLAIIRVAGESILVGITDQNISMIKSLSLLDEDLPQDVPKEFSNLVNAGADEEEGDLARGIKDSVVRRLQEMRNL